MFSRQRVRDVNYYELPKVRNPLGRTNPRSLRSRRDRALRLMEPVEVSVYTPGFGGVPGFQGGGEVYGEAAVQVHVLLL